MKTLTNLYKLLIRFGVILAPIVLLLIRLSWGWELYESGHGHLQNVDEMIAKFTGWGIPHPRVNLYISAYTEMIGGILIMAGLGARLISIPIFFNFCVAYLTASRVTVLSFFRQDPSNFIDDSAFPFLMMSLTILAFGPGILSIDGFLKYTLWKKTPEPALR
jgi:putative oxidoreductase